MNFEDIIYEKTDGVATVTINRPSALNAFRDVTLHEMIEAFTDAWADEVVGVVVLRGAGGKAFSSGGDLKEKKAGPGGRDGLLGVGDYVSNLHYLIRNIPKPVVAAVRGYAIGGGNILQFMCDLTIASSDSVFGQVGPKVGSVDPGFGTAYLARLIGERKAREMWFLCRQYSAREALEMGLVNRVVPAEQLDSEVRAWCDEMLSKSPTALKLAKYSFNSGADGFFGISSM
ncbi:MAG: enoyl-CoA hydratase-related protein, partial [Candidatus Dadabacteria bacterium]|nr:enoyl-CoA hydratase-related protein [Candidatus Dadabacteria bacterium]